MSYLQKYNDYLKNNPDDYNLENSKVLDKFTIYAHKFDGVDGWIEYSDMKGEQENCYLTWVCSFEHTYCRHDGVYVVPIGCLKD